MPDSTTSARPLIVVKNLRKRYGRKTVLKGIDLSIESGQIMALLGDNGAGKTTFIRLISGLTRADRGEIRLGGALMEKSSHELRRYIGLVSHAPLLYENLSGIENLQFFAQMYDIVQPTARIESLLKEVGLWQRRRDPVRTYSRGMVQRLAIARAILHDPPVLLLDEPDTGLDQQSSQMLHDLIQQLGTKNRAILFSTHNLERAASWADQVTFLVNGEITQTLSTDGLGGSELQKIYHQAHALYV